MYEGTDQRGNRITPTPHLPTARYYEIPVVFVVDAAQPAGWQKDVTGQWGDVGMVEGSEADAAGLVLDALVDAGFHNGSEATPWLDCWTMPANQDVTDADNRSGTIVYGSDCEFLAALCKQKVAMLVDLGIHETTGAESYERAQRLADYLGRYTFDGA